MKFQEPRVEFIPIDLTVDATSTTSQAGVETCTGPLAPSNVCPYQATPVYWLDANGNEFDPDP